ncbi:MAG: CopG family transcriptional regulator [Campylobacterales bacterium]|nr:CopG family transcriptional regulator [Campylobacterales bacterium]
MSITLDNEVVKELNAIAEELNEKKSHLIENALMLYFDMLDEKLADKRLRELESGAVKAVPAEEVWKELGL